MFEWHRVRLQSQSQLFAQRGYKDRRGGGITGRTGIGGPSQLHVIAPDEARAVHHHAVSNQLGRNLIEGDAATLYARAIILRSVTLMPS